MVERWRNKVVSNAQPGSPQGHVFFRVIADLIDLKLVNDEDVMRLTDLVRKLEEPISDVNALLREQPSLQLTAGYYAHRFEGLRRAEDAAVESLWHDHYKLLEGASKERLTEAKVTASVRQTPDYQDRSTRAMNLKVLAAQLGGLHAAYECRARMLEQISNNVRLAEKEDLREGERR